MIRFQLLAEDGAARRGRLETAHGAIETPVFMPVGTAATVKTLEPRDLEALGVGILLANTYHLFLRPGHERIARLGGLHRFMAWPGAILTDSGGFQVFSLGERASGRERAGPGLVEIAEEGVTFRSHLDGSRHFLSPERAIEVQEALGPDVMMAFDECPPSLADRAYHEASLARTQRWLVRCRDAWRRTDPEQRCALFGIAQGGLFPDLRARAIADAAALDLPGTSARLTASADYAGQRALDGELSAPLDLALLLRDPAAALRALRRAPLELQASVPGLELAPLAQTNAESLKEYAYFTFIKSDGRKQKLEDPVDYYLEYKDTKLTLHFTLPLKAPVR